MTTKKAKKNSTNLLVVSKIGAKLLYFFLEDPFKKLERIEANMFVFFITLMVQALIEREIRNNMKNQKLQGLEVYPESRNALHPTTSKVFGIFNSVFIYAISEGGDILEEYKDELNPVQKKSWTY